MKRKIHRFDSCEEQDMFFPYKEYIAWVSLPTCQGWSECLCFRDLNKEIGETLSFLAVAGQPRALFLSLVARLDVRVFVGFNILVEIVDYEFRQ